MQVLYRMNKGEASLFPGMDGFARSFKMCWSFQTRGDVPSGLPIRQEDMVAG
jgi:hypothetical protein